MMKTELIMNVPFMLVLTIGAYLMGVWVKKKSGLSLLHPFLISIPVIITVLKVADIPCDFYVKSNRLIDFMLGPCVVSLGLILYEHRQVILRNFISIMSAVLTGSVVGVASVYVLCRIMRLDEVFLLSLEPKSVTTIWPVMARDSSEAKNSSMLATSSGRQGCTFRSLCFII